MAPAESHIRPSDQPRDHHTRFKYVLVNRALAEPEHFADICSAPDGKERLVELWNQVGTEVVHEDSIPPDGLGIRVLGDRPTAILLFIRLPEPKRRNEAYYVGAIPGESADLRFRVFALEKSLLPSTGEPLAMVVEWDAHSRYNFGPAADESFDAFVAAITEIADGERKPLATTPRGSRQPPPPSQEGKKPWWKRLFGIS